MWNNFLGVYSEIALVLRLLEKKMIKKWPVIDYGKFEKND